VGAHEPTPFPWQALPRVDRRSAQLADAMAAWARARAASEVSFESPAGAVRVSAGRAEVLGGTALVRALGDPTSAVVVVRARGRLAPIAYVIAGGALVSALARAILAGPEELDAPRAPTPAERGVLAYAAAAALAGAGAAMTAEPSETAGPLLAAELGEAAVVELETDGACTGWAALAIPLDALAAAPPRGRLALRRAAFVDEPAVAAQVALGGARLPRARAAALAPRDVIVVEGGASLRLGRGLIPGALAPGRAGLIVGGGYARGPMDELIGDDATVEVVACAGTVTLSIRRVLELAPGQVVALGRPTGGEVELLVGAQRVGRGELVDVDGELGVRVLSVEGGRAAG
jgi:type III secretion protein Q